MNDEAEKAKEARYFLDGGISFVLQLETLHKG